MPVPLLLFVALLANQSVPDSGRTALCQKWNALNTQVRDGKADPKTIQTRLASVLDQIGAACGPLDSGDRKWIFPVKGYDVKAIGGKQGSGYQPSGYRYLDGNRHGGHPAHDMFIQDRNQDTRDDQTGLPVAVQSVLSGVVVGLEKNWDPHSALRGGKYVLVFHPFRKIISYYAHLDRVGVEVGQVVKAGQSLGTLGRTGKNAFKKRSPTHLHFMVLRVDPAGLLPVNPYAEWLLFRKKRTGKREKEATQK